MKLVHKKTGKIMNDAQYRNYSLPNGFGLRMDDKEWEYHSLAELNDEWEDYTPQEPLIKDEDVRKIVLAWYKINFPSKDYEIYYPAEDYRLSCHLICIDFQCNRGLENLDEDRTYTIAELCGEEE